MIGRSTLLLTLVAAAHGFRPLVPTSSRRSTLSMIEPMNAGFTSGRYGGTSAYANSQKNFGGVGREDRINRRMENIMRNSRQQEAYGGRPRGASLFGGAFGPGGQRRDRSPGFGNTFNQQRRPQSQNLGGPRMSYNGGFGNNNYGIDSDRRSRSPGLRNNFYDKPTSDFKRPYGGQRGGSMGSSFDDRGMSSYDRGMGGYDRGSSLEPYDDYGRDSRGPNGDLRFDGRRPNWLRGGRGRRGMQDLNGDLRRAATRAWQPTAVYGLLMAIMFTFVADNILRVPIMKGNH